MAVHSQHPASAPPAAPIRETTGHLLLRAWCTFALVLAVGGVGWTHAIGAVPATLLVFATSIASVALWTVRRPPVQWRRLPWFAVAYLAWSALSVAWAPAPAPAALGWLLLLATSVQGAFVASALTWRELVRTVASALTWAVGLTVLFELSVALFVRGPLLPGFVLPSPDTDPSAFWSTGGLFTLTPLLGLWGDADILALVSLLAVVVFAARFAAGAPRRGILVVWIAVAAVLFVHAASPAGWFAAAGVAVVLTTVLLMRTASRPGARTKYYVAYAVAGVVGLVAVWLWRGPVFTATPAHNLWTDVYLQAGVVGVGLLGLTFLAFLWRSWFFAVDRPRWDLRANRPYSPLTLVPTLTGAVLLVQGVAESSPLLLWGWMLIVLFGFKIKQSPLIGVGPTEQTLAMEQGLLLAREPRLRLPRRRGARQPAAASR